MVKLSTNDKEIIEVPFKTISKSCLIKNLVEDLGESDNVIPLAVESTALKNIIEWCENHTEDPDSDKELKKREDIRLNSFDKTYAEKDFEELKDLACAANYLDIKQMIEVVCYHLADKIKELSDKNLPENDEKIRKIIVGED